MGRYGQALLTIAGTVVGAYFGAPALGALAGSIVGSVLFPTKLPTQTGPRLTDTSSTSSNVGAPIPRGWGTFPSAGCIIVQTDIKEVDEITTQGGKGAPSQTVDTPTYYQSFAIGINDGLIAGVRVIWANGKPIYDRRPQGGTDTAGPTESDTAYKARMAANQQLESQFTLYLGSEDQLVDPTLEAFYGVGNITAFRGLAYIVFHNWKNKAEDGNRMPATWRFECYTEGSATDTDGSAYSTGVVMPWITIAQPPLNPQGSYKFTLLYLDVSLPGGPGPEGTVYDTFEEAYEAGAVLYTNAAAGSPPSLYMGTGVLSDDIEDGPLVGSYNLDSITAQHGFPAGLQIAYRSSTDGYAANFNYNIANPGHFYYDGDSTHIDNPNSDGGSLYAHPGNSWWSVWGVTTVLGVPVEDGVPFPGPFPPPPYTSGSGWENFFYFVHIYDLVILAERLEQPPLDPCINGTPVPGLDDWVVLDGQLAKCGPWTKVTLSGDGGDRALVLSQYQPRKAQKVDPTKRAVIYPLNPILPPGDPKFFDEDFWTEAYEAAVARGDLPSGFTYESGGYGGIAIDHYPRIQNYYYTSNLTLSSVDTGFALVSDILHDLWVECGMDPADIDTTGVEDLTIVGYVRSNTMACKDAMLPLAQACFFDGIESNGKLSFRLRGGEITKTLTVDDLGVSVDDGTTGNTTALTQTESQDVDLPRSVRVHYLSQSRDYETGQQNSPSRLDTKAVNDVDIQLPMVLLDTQAKQIADKLWASQWAERVAYQTVVDASFQDIEPADAIAIPSDGEVVRVRITDLTDSLPATRSLSMVRDDNLAFVSYAVASQVPVTTTRLTIITPAASLFLDLPALVDTDNDGGFYAAMYGLLPDDFKAASLYRSVDNGGNYSRIVSTSTTAIKGNVPMALPSGPTTIFDNGNVLTVELYDVSDILENSTRDDVLNGANACAVGADDRWEIVQFTTATHLSGSLYKLSGLLRGRRGTEWAVGTSQAGDSFVMLSTVVRVPLDTTLLNKDELYKTVGSGSTLDAAGTETFQGNGVALRPFSPAYLDATKDAVSNDIAITWLRRSRIGQTLQSGKDVALNEAVEDYEVDILDAPSGNVLRTISVSTQSAVYKGADQLADSGTHISTVSCVVYQISEVVGRGYGTSATLTPQEN